MVLIRFWYNFDMVLIRFWIWFRWVGFKSQFWPTSRIITETISRSYLIPYQHHAVTAKPRQKQFITTHHNTSYLKRINQIHKIYIHIYWKPFILEISDAVNLHSSACQWIGLREHLNRKPCFWTPKFVRFSCRRSFQLWDLDSYPALASLRCRSLCTALLGLAWETHVTHVLLENCYSNFVPFPPFLDNPGYHLVI